MRSWSGFDILERKHNSGGQSGFPTELADRE